MAYKKYTKDENKPAFTHDDYKKQVADRFLTLLDQDDGTDPMSWVKGWVGSDIPISLSSGREYRGVNAAILQFTALIKGWDDPRWTTFNKLKDFDGAHVNKGEKGTRVEYWFAKDIKEKLADGSKNPNYGKTMSWSEAERYCKEHGRDLNKEFKPTARYFTVFNAAQCTGLPGYIKEKDLNADVKQAEFVTKAAEGMGVEIKHDGGAQAYYHRENDDVHLPKPEKFNSQYAYDSTALHEIGHASGAKWRLNRTKGTVFADENYAREELVAELTSAMAMANLPQDEKGLSEYLKDHAENHMKYLKSWTEDIKKDPDVLFDALKKAETATDYIEACAGVISADNFLKRNRDIPVWAIKNPTDIQVNIDPETKCLKLFRKEKDISNVSNVFMSVPMFGKEVTEKYLDLKDFSVAEAKAYMDDACSEKAGFWANQTGLSEKEQAIIVEKIMPLYREIFDEEIHRAVAERVNDILDINPEDIPIQEVEHDDSLELDLAF